LGDNLDQRELFDLRQSKIISNDEYRTLQRKLLDMIDNDVEMGKMIDLIDTYELEEEEYIYSLEKFNKKIIEGE